MEQSTFLSDVREQLPEYCIFDKGKVGCGGTTMALKAKEPYVICVPFRSLIENKISQYKKGEILGVHSGTTKNEIREYVETSSNPKIMVTYNSLNKLNDVIDTDEFKLLVDEYHLLFTQYSFRSEAVRVVLENYFRYKSYVFMTATPIEEEFILKELKHLPVVKQEWDNQVSIKVNTVLCERTSGKKSVLSATAQMIIDFLTGKEQGNAYIFVNSVDFISTIINSDSLKFENMRDDKKYFDYLLTKENCKVCYSKYNERKLRIPNSGILGETKKINFLTSTAFEGSDIYDPEGRIIIISDPSQPQTMLDISTSINQIAGRIRDSRYIDTITHIYAPTRYSELGYEDFKKHVYDGKDVAYKTVEYHNSVPVDFREKLQGLINTLYISVNPHTKMAYFDENKIKIDLFNYRIVRGLYTINATVNDEYSKRGFDVSESLCNSEINAHTGVKFEGSLTFGDIVRELKEMAENGVNMAENERFKYAFRLYPFLKDAIEKIGWGGMGTLHYSMKAIKDQVLAMSDKSIDNKVALKLSRSFMVGEFYPMAYVKSKIQEAYKLLGLPGGKAIDICIYYNVRETMRHRKDGYLIISKKMVFKP